MWRKQKRNDEMFLGSGHLLCGPRNEKLLNNWVGRLSYVHRNRDSSRYLQILGLAFFGSPICARKIGSKLGIWQGQNEKSLVGCSRGWRSPRPRMDDEDELSNAEAKRALRKRRAAHRQLCLQAWLGHHVACPSYLHLGLIFPLCSRR